MKPGKVLAIIPARGGSKRLPEKNKRLLAGKPLIVWTIEAALASKRVGRTIVSTDDPEIADIARAAGADVPFLRPTELASDTADSVSVARHALTFLEGQGDRYDSLILLQPTSPLRTGAHIDEAVALMEQKDGAGVVSVCEAEHTPLGMNVLPKDLSLDGFIPDSIAHKRSQDLPTYYRINGALYLVSIPTFLAESSFFPKRSAFAYIMDRESSIDIDVEMDLIMAETILRLKPSKGKQSHG